MSQTTYPQGGTINYGYGFAYFDPQANPYYRSTVVTSKSRSAGGSWAFAYSPGGPGSLDTTTINSPSGTEVYRHIGPNYVSSGTVWTVGLLKSKTIGSLQTETYSWDKQKISSENFLRPGIFNLKVDAGETNAPILTQRVIEREGATYTTTYSGFDTYGNPANIAESGTFGGNRTTNLTYNINTSKWIINQLKNESFSGGSITRDFDGDGNMISITRDGVTTSHTYDSQGSVSSTTFPRSLKHYYSNYKRGIPQTESQPEGVSISRVVNDAGNVTSETNGEGRTTGFGYDGLNRVTSIDYPTGTSVTISYGSASKTATRGSLTEATVYNGFGQPTSVSLGGITRTFQIDAFGRKTFESDPGSGSGTTYEYDILNRVKKVTNADSTSQTISFGAGNKTVTDERSKSTTFTYRAYGNPDQQFLMGIAAPESSANVSIQRNSRDLTTQVTQAGLTRYYGYYSNYYLQSVSNPETGATTYGRDAAGNMTSRSVGSSGTTNYTYDDQNRLSVVTYPGSTPSVTNTYNKVHKLLTATSSTGTRSFGYDWNGNLTSETLVVDGLTFTAVYTYNGLDQLSAITYPRSNATVNYAPDTLGRPTQVSGYVNSVSYWPSGQINQIAYANGTTTSYGQNARLWPSNFSTQRGGTTYISSGYSYDGAGNLTNINDSVDNTYDRTLTYDGINRLSTVSGPWGSGTINYNGTGNITSQVFGGTSLNYTYDGSNRLSSVSGSRNATYGYDAYGNIVSASGTAYTYDGAPNLRCINCSDPINKIEYAYDATNHRSVITKGGFKTYEMYGSNGNQLVEFTPLPNSRLVQYIYLGGKRIAQRVSN
ncbi:RHS repeat protein [Rhodoferax sp. AJA081-3]|nr:RHS repeat protein [Rhodoferax sp. AJA081-3]